MSLCFRTIPNKFTPFVNTRKKVIQLEQRLTKQGKSTFLEEFLGKKITAESRVESYQNKPLDLSIESLLDTRQSLQLLRKYGFIYNSKLKSNIKLHFDTKDTSLIKNVRFNAVDSVKYIQPHNSFESLVYTVDEQTNRQAIPKETSNDRPSQEQLQKIFNTLQHDLPRFFVQALNYTIYEENIVFENNIRGVTSRGLFGYIKQVAFAKIIGHLKFAYVKFEVMKMTIDPEDSSIKVRWQIHGITTMKVVFKFWKFKPWNIKEALQYTKVWHDGFSTFYVDGKGKVFKHVADKMIPDQDKAPEKVKPSLVSKLALIIGLSRAKFSNPFKLSFSSKLPLSKSCDV